MPNIFDGIRKMPEEALKLQLALFENVTLLNVAKETGTRVLSGLSGVANSFSETLFRKNPVHFEATDMTDRVRAAIAGYAGKERVQLIYELKGQILLKCGLSAGAAEEISENRLSCRMAAEAARAFAVQKYASPANKIEAVSIQYKEAFLKALHNRLVKEQGAQAADTDQQLQQRLNAVSLETKRDLQQHLLPKEFSGKGIGRILRLERSTKYLSETVTYLGTDCFDETRTSVETALHAIAGLKKLSRILLAGLIWQARTAYGKEFTVARELLPSYIPSDRLADYLQKEKAFRQLMQQRIDAAKQLEKCEKALERHEEELAQARERFSMEQRAFDEAQMAFMGLESRKADYVAGRQPENETKNYYRQVNETKRRLDRAQAICEKQRRKAEELAQQGDRLVTARNTARMNDEVAHHKSDVQVRALADEIMRQWKAYFFGLTFTSSVFEQAAVELTAQERLDIEEFLKEIHDSKEPQAFESEPGVLYAGTASGKQIKIRMEAFEVQSIERLQA